MLYPFPLPTWLEEGTTSHTMVTISLWGIITVLPGSVLGCWVFKPQSRIIWIMAETLWVLASLLLLLSLIIGLPRNFMLQDVSPHLALTATVVLLFIAVPAAVSGSSELARHPSAPRGFRDGLAWGCAIPFIMITALSILVPSLIHSPEAYRHSNCKNNLKQIGLALHNYYDQEGTFPDSQFVSDGSPARSWRVEMLPFVDHKPLFDSYDQTQTWNSETNTPVATQNVSTYICPSVPAAYQRDTQGRWYTAYATVNGPNTAFPNGKGLALKEIPDGSSNTVLIAEACGQQIVWTEPQDIQTTTTTAGINLPGSKPHQSPGIWSSYHTGVARKGLAFTLFVDGSVRALSVDTDPQVLRAITTANGGEEVGEF
jgi:hypothetical protein